MGAPQWTKEELDCFHNNLLKLSHYPSYYLDKENGGMDFEELAPVMQYEMKKVQKKSKRTYTRDILYQHYYQHLMKNGIQRGTKGPSVPLTPSKVARVRQLRKLLKEGFFGDVPAAEIRDLTESESSDYDSASADNMRHQRTPTRTGPPGHRRSSATKRPRSRQFPSSISNREMPPPEHNYLERYAPMEGHQENEGAFPEFPLVPPIERNFFTIARDRRREREVNERLQASRRCDANERGQASRRSRSPRLSDDDSVNEFQRPSNSGSKLPPQKKPSRTPAIKRTSTKKSASRKPAVNEAPDKTLFLTDEEDFSEDDMDPRSTCSGSLSPVGVERFDIQYEVTRPLRHPEPMVAGLGVASKPWPIFGANDVDEINFDDGEEDNRPDFGGFDW